MGGRIYDAGLGRFLQADPIVQAPMNSQSYNRYAYVFNNPMTMTDPSGFSAWTDFRDKILKPIVAIVASIVVPFYAVMSWGWTPAFGYAAGGFAAGGIMTGSLRGAVAASILAYVGGGPGTFEPEHAAMVAADAIDPEVGKVLNYLYNGYDSESFTNSLLNYAHEYKNQKVSEEVTRFANKHGLTLTEFNALLTLNSFVGRELVGSRLNPNQDEDGSYNIMGFTTRGEGARGLIGVIWDVNDTILGYQGLIDAVGHEYISIDGYKKLGACHSLGTLTCNNLVARGYADSAQLNSLPFGNVAVSENAKAAKLGRWDIINGGYLGFMFNPVSNFTACESFPCHGYEDNYEDR